MNVIRCIDVAYNASKDSLSNEGALIDFEYMQDSENNFKSVDVRVYAIINSVVGRKLPINIIDKLVIAKEMLRYLESEKESK